MLFFIHDAFLLYLKWFFILLYHMRQDTAHHVIASGGQGGFFEKPPPWTPRKTFYSPSGGWVTVIRGLT
jgi:hypothetical protein